MFLLTLRIYLLLSHLDGGWWCGGGGGWVRRARGCGRLCRHSSLTNSEFTRNFESKFETVKCTRKSTTKTKWTMVMMMMVPLTIWDSQNGRSHKALSNNEIFKISRNMCWKVKNLNSEFKGVFMSEKCCPDKNCCESTVLCCATLKMNAGNQSMYVNFQTS